MPLVALRDRDAIERWLRRDAAVHLYELGDLDDFFWPSTTWYGLAPADAEHDRLDAIALLYAATALPVLVVMGRGTDLGAARALLDALTPVLPSRFYTHLVPGASDVLARSFALEPHGTHARMVLGARARIDAVDTSEAVELGPADEEELAALYAHAYPGNWFDARMLETRAYFGVRRDGTLASVAGVHVVSRRHRVAALGNIATAPAHRGRGLARIAIAAACKSLAHADPIGLNVATDNHAAVALYASLGFAHVTDYEEHLATLARSVEPR
ncbi:MAG: GCN5-related N-acetyltransferase [Labilithrix sp.]|nr:GCN5-related N-acetyltransferase [Labilithrix sp.]